MLRFKLLVRVIGWDLPHEEGPFYAFQPSANRAEVIIKQGFIEEGGKMTDLNGDETEYPPTWIPPHRVRQIEFIREEEDESV
jgi:hypothetical protein